MENLITGPNAMYWIGGAVGLCVLLLFYMLGSMVQTVMEGYRSGYGEAVQSQLEGMFIFIPPQQLFMLKITTAVLGFVIGALLTIQAPALFIALVAGLIAATICFFVPDKILTIMYQRRLDRFNDQLIDALATMSNGLRSGLNFSQSVQVLVEEMPDPIAQEFNLVLQQIQLGVQTEKALEDLAGRVPDADLDILVTAINIARGVGGNLAEIFDNMASVIRDRKRIEGKIKAITSQGRLQAIVMASMPAVIAVALHIIDPVTLAYLYKTLPGVIIIFFVCVMDYIGYRIIKAICTIDI